MSSEGASQSTDDILGAVRAALMSEFGLAEAEIRVDAHLVDDLDLDSIDAVDLAVRFEETMGLTLRDDDLKSVETVSDVVELIRAGLAASAQAP